MKAVHFLVACLALASATATPEPTARIVVQHASLAGFRYYEGWSLWQDMQVGDPLTLVRELGNAHDPNAIRVEWRGRTLGYVPRRENAHLARQLDHGAPLAARITSLHKARNGRNRVSYEVSVALK